MLASMHVLRNVNFLKNCIACTAYEYKCAIIQLFVVILVKNTCSPDIMYKSSDRAKFHFSHKNV